MNNKAEPIVNNTANGSGDIFKYTIAVVLALGGLVFWYWYSAPERAMHLGGWSSQIRGLAVIVGLISAAAVFMFTTKGRDTREFFAEARFELRKVIWPTRQESLRTTGVVIIAVTIISLILFGFDSIIQYVMKWFLG